MMKVQELRDAIDGVAQWWASYRGCTLSERPNEARLIRSAVERLNTALEQCKTAKVRDRERAEQMLRDVAPILAEYPG